MIERESRLQLGMDKQEKKVISKAYDLTGRIKLQLRPLHPVCHKGKMIGRRCSAWVQLLMKNSSGPWSGP